MPAASPEASRSSWRFCSANARPMPAVQVCNYAISHGPSEVFSGKRRSIGGSSIHQFGLQFMPDLVALTLTALLSVCRTPACGPDEHVRLASFAVDIAHVVTERDEVASWLPGVVDPLPWRGPGVRAASALALVAIASHESGLRAEVADCRIVGSDLPSISSFQLVGWHAFGPYTRRELCGSPRKAAERALAVLAGHATRASVPARWFAGYASGDPGRDPAAGRRQCRLWEWLTRSAGVEVGGCYWLKRTEAR